MEIESRQERLHFRLLSLIMAPLPVQSELSTPRMAADTGTKFCNLL